jgi:hypothetical protein
MGKPGKAWPPLSAERDGATIATLHLFAQIVGKVPTALLPWRNHGWHLTLHVTPRGLATELIHAPSGPFQLTLDLIGHCLRLEDAQGIRTVPLRPMSVAHFHAEAMALVRDVAPGAQFHGAPNEIEPAVPFAEDREPRRYDPDSATRLHAALVEADRLFRLFRSGFLARSARSISSGAASTWR